jgi:hypothetical protein
MISLTAFATTYHWNSANLEDSMETTCPMLYPRLANGCQVRMPPMLLADVKRKKNNDNGTDDADYTGE